MIQQLRKYRDQDNHMETNYLLAHNLYGKATIPPTDKVYISLHDFFCKFTSLNFTGLLMVRC